MKLYIESMQQYFQFQNLKGNSYIIRDIDPAIDTQHYFEYIQHPEVIKWMDISPYTSIDEVRKDLYYFSRFDENTEGKCFAVALLGTNKLIGTCGYNWKNDVAELVTDLNYNYFDKGMPVFKWLIDHIFQNTNASYIAATILKNNIRCINMAKKLNFTQKKRNNKIVYTLFVSPC